jgi:hypothetical protein
MTTQVRNMKKSILIIASTVMSLILLSGCEDALKDIIEDEKLQSDSEAIVEDVFDLGEQILKDEMHLPKDKKNENEKH